MGRSIEQENTFLQVLLKLIPSELIAVFIFVQGVLPRVFLPHLLVALILVGITPLYLSRAARVTSRPQLVVSTLSFVVWIYAMGIGPLRFVRPPFYEPWHGAVALAVWTLVPPMFLATSSPEEPAAAPGPAAVPARSGGRDSTAAKQAPRKRASKNPRR